MNVSYKSHQSEKNKRTLRGNGTQNVKVREKKRLSKLECGPKRVVRCYTCDYIYNRTSKKDCAIHSKKHLEYLNDQ